MELTRHTRLIVQVAAILAATATALQAGIVTWDGGNNSGNPKNLWNQSGNWDVTPTFDATTDIVMNGTTKQSNQVNQAYTINTLTFNNDGFDILSYNSGYLTLAGTASGITNTAGSNIIDCNLTLGAANTWTVTAGTLTVNGTVTNATYLLTVTGAGDTTIDGAIGNGTGGLTKSGTGTLTLAGSNGYTGGTTISSGTVIVNNARALGSSGTITNSGTLAIGSGVTFTRPVTFNSGSTLAGKGTYTLSGTFTVGSGVTVAPGIGDIGTLNIGTSTTFAANSILAVDVGAGAGNADLLQVTGTLDTSANNTLALNMTGTTQGTYRIANFSAGISYDGHALTNGGFANVTGLAPAYRLAVTPGANGHIDLFHKATVGTITATPAGPSIITGGTTAVSFTVLNAAPTGSDNFTSLTAVAGTNTGGSGASGAIAVAPGSTSGAVSGLVFNGTTVGLSQAGTFTVSDASAFNTLTGTVSVNVYDHASGSLGGSTLTMPAVILGYGTALASGNTINVSNATGTRVNLKTTNNGPLGSLTLGNVLAVTPGGSLTLSATLAAGKGVGGYTQPFTLTYADDSGLSGNSSSLGTATVNVTGTVYDHASGSLGGSTLTMPAVILGYGAALASSNTINVSNATGTRVNLKTSNNGPLNGFTLGNVAAIAPGGSLALSATLGTGKGVGGYTQPFTLTYADDSGLPGNSSSLGSATINVTGTVYDHASGSLGGSTLTMPAVILGYGAAQTSDSINVSNASGTRVNLKTTNNGPLSSLTLGNVAAVAPGGSLTLSATLAAGKGVGGYTQPFTLTYADDSGLPGNSSSLGSATINVTGTVYDHASGSLGGSTLTMPDVILGYGAALASSNTINVSNSTGTRVSLKTTNNGPLSSLALGNVLAVAPGGSLALSATLAAGKGVGVYTQPFTLTYADDSNAPGHSSSLGSATVNVTGTVYDHASGSLSQASVVMQDVVLGYAGPVTSNDSFRVLNASGLRVNLKTIGGLTSGNLSLSANAGGVLPNGSSPAITALLAPGQGLGSYNTGFTLGYADDSTLPGASAGLGSNTVTVSGRVLDHALPSLTSTGADIGRVMWHNVPTYLDVTTTVGNASGVRASLAITAMAGMDDSGHGLIDPGTARLFTARVNLNVAGTVNSVHAMTFSDDTSLAGALPTQGLTYTVTGFVVKDRVVHGNAVGLGNVLLHGYRSATATLSTTGDSSAYTKIKVAGQLFDHDGETAAATIAQTFAAYGPAGGSQSLPVVGEGLTDESPVPVSVPYTANVGWASPKAGHAFSDPLVSTVDAAHRNLAGLASKTLHDATAGIVGSEATLLGGTDTVDGTLSMAWRTRTDAEVAVGGGHVPGLLSDVVDLSGMVKSGPHQTDVFVLQLSYDDSAFAAGEEAQWAADGRLRLGYLDPATNRWIGAIAGNIGVNTSDPAMVNVQGDWTGVLQLGAWGVNTSKNIVWAVLDHNSEYGVVPEPGTLVLLLAGMAALLMWRRRTVR